MVSEQALGAAGKIAELEAQILALRASPAVYQTPTPAALPTPPLRLDLGCGLFKKPGFVGVDSLPLKGVDMVADLTKTWPWPDESVDEVHSSQLLEHLTMEQRIHFMHELHRVMKHGAKAQIITPHWCSNRAYGDPTHISPPVCEMFYCYFNKKWRDEQAPHVIPAYPLIESTDFDYPPVLAHNVHPALNGRAPEFVNDKLAWSKEAAADLMATITKR